LIDCIAGNHSLSDLTQVTAGFSPCLSTQLNEHLCAHVLKHLNVHIYLVSMAYRYHNQLISRTDNYLLFRWLQKWTSQSKSITITK